MAKRALGLLRALSENSCKPIWGAAEHAAAGVVPCQAKKGAVMRARLAGAVCYLLATFSAAPAMDYAANTRALKLVKEVVWHVNADNDAPEGACAVSKTQLSNSVQLVANQSNTQLKFTTRADEIGQATVDPQRLKFVPSLEINLDTFELSGICVADFEATVKVFLENTNIIETDEIVWWPRYEVWTKDGIIHSSPSDFGRRVNDVVDDAVRSFIKDWTASRHVSVRHGRAP
ncbi:hypothetical protein [Methylocella sp.]|jgi:hypothetical protein|uniref:hypothetical protein n=1 Tax=Methylocella sp. TaxID=1978226 RepID=UPI003C29D0BD